MCPDDERFLGWFDFKFWPWISQERELAKISVNSGSFPNMYWAGYFAALDAAMTMIEEWDSDEGGHDGD